MRVASRLSLGSSPRMRGARADGPVRSGRGRIIPADAGSTEHDSDCANAWRDHPRGCGEHSWPVLVSMVAPGSSPRMRGALFLAELRITGRRIIPADAGSTQR